MNRICYWVHERDDCYEIVRVEENEPGFWPTAFVYADREPAETEANDMNNRRGISHKDAVMIVASSMKAQNKKE